MKRRAFTITELIVAMVVLALVVMATTSIVRKKMEKVSYSQYWMGYNTALDIAKDVQVFDDSSSDSDDECDGVEFADNCWSEPFKPTTISKDECKKLITNGYGIKACNYSSDFWAGAVKQCGGTKNMPSMQQLADLASVIYGKEGMEAKKNYSGLTIANQELFDTFKAKSSFDSDFYVWSSEEDNSRSAYERNFYTTYSYYYSYDRTYSHTLAVCLADAEPVNLCDAIKDKFNTSDYDCTLANATDSSDFTNPHITFSNGLRLFMGSDFKELFPDAESENDKTGYKIYIDINGSKGKGILWEDVFPFYVLKSGKVLAGYPTDAEIGGNNNEYLSVNVLYDDFSSGKRVVKILQSNMNYRQAMCATGMIKSATYCGGITVLPECNNVESDCRLKVKSPIKIF